MGEPVGLPSMGSHRVGHDRSDLAVAAEQSRQHGISKGRTQISGTEQRIDQYINVCMCVHMCVYVCVYTRVGNGNPLQYSCLGNPTDRGACRAIVRQVVKELDTT